LSTPVQHHAAGLIISADRRLPGFVAAAQPQQPDVRIHLGVPPHWHDASSASVYVADHLDGAGTPIVRVSRSPEGFHFHYADQTCIWIQASGADVWCTWPESASLEDACTYLSGPILSLLLRIRGALALHASAVQIGSGAIGFVGSHGVGKSTLAAALGAAGCRVVTDDVLHLRAEGGRWMAEPFASMLKLWPDGAHLALGPVAELPAIAAGWDKRALHLGGAIPAASAPLPLTALAWLAPRGSAAAIEPLSAATTLVHLAANSSAAHLLDSALRAVEFATLSSLVRCVPCAAITAPSAPAAFPHFVTRVLAWAQAFGMPSAE
jgi:hypothetical protein